jgi:hypothetical protein
MLTCIPQSLCLWDYRVFGTSRGEATITFNFFTEQGSIWLGNAEFTIRKHGPLSGHWTLEHGDRTLADASKPNPLFRSFELQVQDLHFTLTAQTAFTRCYDMFSGGRRVGTIQPLHPFTRRASIECAAEVPELAQLFAFWLAVLTWRRAAQNSAAHSGV